MNGIQYAELYGENVAYRDEGTGPVVVLVHGITSSMRTWNRILPEMAKTHRVIALDLLGHGESSHRRGDHSLGAQAATIRDLLSHLGVKRASFVGHSLGGGVVLQVCYLFPRLVEKIVLVASGGLGDDVAPLLRAAALPAAPSVMPLLFWGWPKRLLHRAEAILSGKEGRLTRELEEATGTMLVLVEKERRRAFLSTLRSVVDRKGQYVSAISRLSALEGRPVMVIWGEKDPIIPVEHGKQAAELLSAPLLVVPGGHFPHHSAPEEFTRNVLSFLAGDDGEATR